jgi:hypothetical protein
VNGRVCSIGIDGLNERPTPPGAEASFRWALGESMETVAGTPTMDDVLVPRAFPRAARGAPPSMSFGRRQTPRER